MLLLMLLASFALAAGSFQVPCLLRSAHLQLRLPSQGFKWAEGEEARGRCRVVTAKRWVRESSGSLELFVYADGPSGSGRYWTVMVGLATRGQMKPTRGICLTTSTV